MRINFNSKDAVFAIKAENEEEKAQLKTSEAAVDERGAGNPFLPQRDELVTQDMHTCDLCGRWCSSPVYSIGLIYGGQAKTFTEVCADCMWRLKFSPVRTISLDAYRLFEQWRLSQSEADE